MMQYNLRKARSILLFLAGLLPLTVSLSSEGFAMMLGIALIVSATLTAIFLFLNFDKKLNQKVLMEGLVDAFAGLVLFTYPQSLDPFLLINFSFWSFFMGVLFLAAGLFDSWNKAFLWIYSLMGIMMVVFGFVLLNYEPDKTVSAFYLVSFVLLFYGVSNLYLMYRKKADIY